MELRQLRYFVAIAEELNFTRAAERLFITQPPLSQQIKLLEAELGVQLLQRGPRGVTLTDAGKTFLVHARSLTEGVKTALRATTETASGTIGTVRIACINSALFSIMPTVLKHLRRQFASLDLSVTELGSQAQVGAILHGEVDLGIMHLTRPSPGLRIEKMLAEPLCAVLPARHRLAPLQRIALSELADADFVFSKREVAPVTFDHMIATCVRAGFSPRIRHTAGQLSSIVQMVRLGLGVALVPRSLSAQRVSGVKFVRVTDRLATNEVFVASRDIGVTEVVGRVREAIMELPMRTGA
jgi:DNA-binding transcriptional LysR family regulator